MIPDFQLLRKRSKNLKIQKKPYFAMSEEYINLREKLSWYNLIDMVFYPLYILFTEFTPMCVFGLLRGIQKWVEFIRYIELEQEVFNWGILVKGLGGPWISTNNGKYHPYVYADGMERIVGSA